MNKYVFNLEEYPSFNSSINLNDPTEFHFSYQKQISKQNQQLSPVETSCGSCDTKNPKQLQFFNHDNKQFKKTFSNKFELIVVNECIEKYDKSVSRYLQKTLKVKTQAKLDFLSVREFQQLTVQDTQLLIIMEQYEKMVDQNKSILGKQVINHLPVKWFLQEITYLNKRLINFELLAIVDELLLNYNETLTKRCNYKLIETTESLFYGPKINFINMRFNSFLAPVQDVKQAFFQLIRNLSQIIDSLMFQNSSEKHTQQTDQEDGCTKRASKTNLYQSKKDLWDSQQQDQQLLLGKCLKKVKLN